MAIPPGIRYLCTMLPRVVTPALVVYTLVWSSRRFLALTVPAWLTATCCALSLPALVTVYVQYKEFVVRRAAAAHGAVVCPPIPGSIGGIHMLSSATKRTLAEAYPGEPMAVLMKKLGNTVSVSFLWKKRILTVEPESIKAILATEFARFEKGAELRSIMEPLLGAGVFAADGDMWKFHRTMTRPFFHRQRISDFDLFDQHAENAIGQFKARLRAGYPADFQDMVSRFTLDTATAFLFDKDLHSLSAGLPYPFSVAPSGTDTVSHPANVFAKAFGDAQLITAHRTRFGVHWPLAEFWKDKLVEPMRIVHDFLDPVLKEAVAKKRAKGGTEEEKNTADGGGEREVQEGETLLEHLVNYTEDHTVLRDEILNISVAGRDTTASLLTFTVYMLAENPKVLHKLREEILNVVGPHRAPTMEDFKELKYLRAVLNETLRLYTPVPFNQRTAQQPTIFHSSDGRPPIYIPAGTRLVFSTLIMHRRIDLWGPDALKFDPDRFLDARLHKYLTPNPFIFLPFNAGPRICLGQQFAYHESSFFLVRLLQTFAHIALAPDAQPPNTRPPAAWAADDTLGWKAHEKVHPKSHLTMFVQGGLWVRMEEARGAGVGEE
ncbi:cytochrome P450 [Mycena rebaudengoi]|nr:cytochrome P450 [Mycena rebaudengoi]